MKKIVVFLIIKRQFQVRAGIRRHLDPEVRAALDSLWTQLKLQPYFEVGETATEYVIQVFIGICHSGIYRNMSVWYSTEYVSLVFNGICHSGI